jgi:hypothetical protein
VATKKRLSAEDEPAFTPGEWYQFAAPGGFLLFGRYVKELGFGAHRFENVRHMRNAGGVELPEMCRSGTGNETVLTQASWRHWNGTPIWWAPWDADEVPS